MTQSPISENEVAAFSAKLDEWAKTLAPKERALLRVILRTAEATLPEGGELADSQLEGVAGGRSSSEGFQGQTTHLLGSLVKGARFGPGPQQDDFEYIMLLPSDLKSSQSR